MGPFGSDGGGLIEGVVSRGGRRGGGRRRVRRRPRRGSGGSPAAPAGRSDCGRPAPRSAGRRCRARAGSTTAGRARDAGRSTRRPRSRGRRRARRIEHHEERLRPPGERRQPAEPIGDPGRPVGPGQPAAGQVEHEQVHRAAGQQAPAMASPSSSVSGVMTTSHSSRTPRATASTGSKLRERSSQATIEPAPGPPRRRAGERGPAARAVATDRDAGRPRQAARPEDRIEAGEPGGDDPVVGCRGSWLCRSSGTDATAGAVAKARRHLRDPAPIRPAELRHPIEPGGPRQRRPHLRERSSSDR